MIPWESLRKYENIIKCKCLVSGFSLMGCEINVSSKRWHLRVKEAQSVTAVAFPPYLWYSWEVNVAVKCQVCVCSSVLLASSAASSNVLGSQYSSFTVAHLVAAQRRACVKSWNYSVDKASPFLNKAYALDKMLNITGRWQILKNNIWGIGSQPCNPITWVVKSGWSRVQGYLPLYSEFEASLEYTRPNSTEVEGTEGEIKKRNRKGKEKKRKKERKLKTKARLKYQWLMELLTLLDFSGRSLINEN